MAKHGPETRNQILRAALKQFANGGYAATSVQQIVDAARVSKPALYYHFADKAGLFRALVHEAHDERYRILREAAKTMPAFAPSWRAFSPGCSPISGRTGS